MSLSEQTARVAGGGKNTLKTILQKLGVSVGAEYIDQYPQLAEQISDKLNPDNLLSAQTGALFGLDASGTVNQALAVLGKYNQYWWQRKPLSYKIVLATKKYTVVAGGTGSVQPNTVQYSTNVDVSSGTPVLISPSTITVSYATYTNANILAGKYWTTDYSESPNLYYTEPGSTAIQYVTGGYVAAEIYAQVVSTTPSSDGEWEYIQSNERNTYPDSGVQDGYEYQYLGVPFENAIGPAKIETGSYTGTGTYGQSNPTSLSFNFVPKILLIQKVNPSLGYGATDGLVFLIKGSTSFFFYTNGSDNGTNTITHWDTTVSWYLTMSTNYQYDAAEEQLNSGTYNYVAIG